MLIFAKAKKATNGMLLSLMVIITIAISMVTHLRNVGQSQATIFKRQSSKDFAKIATDMDTKSRHVGLK